ncbi:16S rRNA (guanine(527)-N(7))-methyltransferase [hydrothermal vent metagenome]|uniref:16S rRNA (Guanine(527)-N(7))-methyltransferase n=1 Tax=hydrothermal vent metagenome TaxID=652676 RepID=A0A3B0TUV6_9ZZZZ
MDIILKYFQYLSAEQKERFAKLEDLYTEWNNKINVISRKDISGLYERHVLHSLSIAKVISFKPGTSILDAGTGGGFPGIPLSILFPAARFHLVDSIGKKIKVVNEVALSLGLENVVGEKIRLEEIQSNYDFVVSRAVTSFPKFASWVKGKIKYRQQNELANGILYLKGGKFEEELKPFGKKVTVYPLDSFFTEEFFETKKLIHLPLP